MPDPIIHSGTEPQMSMSSWFAAMLRCNVKSSPLPVVLPGHNEQRFEGLTTLSGGCLKYLSVHGTRIVHIFFFLYDFIYTEKISNFNSLFSRSIQWSS